MLKHLRQSYGISIVTLDSSTRIAHSSGVISSIVSHSVLVSVSSVLKILTSRKQFLMVFDETFFLDDENNAVESNYNEYHF